MEQIRATVELQDAQAHWAMASCRSFHSIVSKPSLYKLLVLALHSTPHTHTMAVAQVDAALQSMGWLRSTIGELFDMAGCNTAAVRHLLGSEGPTEASLLGHLGVLELRCNEVLQVGGMARGCLAGQLSRIAAWRYNIQWVESALCGWRGIGWASKCAPLPVSTHPHCCLLRVQAYAMSKGSQGESMQAALRAQQVAPAGHRLVIEPPSSHEHVPSMSAAGAAGWQQCRQCELNASSCLWWSLES